MIFHIESLVTLVKYFFILTDSWGILILWNMYFSFWKNKAKLDIPRLLRHISKSSKFWKYIGFSEKKSTINYSTIWLNHKKNTYNKNLTQYIF